MSLVSGSSTTAGGVRPPFEPAPAPITVLAVGNPIMGDDGLGPELLARLEASPSDLVGYVDGVTGGMELVPVVSEATRLLILDAVAGPVPGTVLRLDGDQVPRMLASKLSPHQVGLLDVLAAARLIGSEPEQVIVVGVVPELVDLHVGLSEPVTRALPRAEAVAREVLAEWAAELADAATVSVPGGADR